jgi:hypothetical protein
MKRLFDYEETRFDADGQPLTPVKTSNIAGRGGGSGKLARALARKAGKTSNKYIGKNIKGNYSVDTEEDKKKKKC